MPLAYERPPESVAFRRRYPSSFSSTRPLRVLFLGQVNLRKGVEPLLDAIRLLSGEPIEFTFVGPVQISIPADLRNNRQVHWHGPAPRPATGQFYKDADVFLFPTFSDGFGLTQLEAQAWKLPVITTRFCGEVVEHGQKWLDPARDHAAIHCEHAPRMPAGSEPAAGGIGPQRRGREVWTC